MQKEVEELKDAIRVSYFKPCLSNTHIYSVSHEPGFFNTMRGYDFVHTTCVGLHAKFVQVSQIVSNSMIHKKFNLSLIILK